jgi:1-deoxy-D-xylulose-5-phosphate reductoisomerase
MNISIIGSTGSIGTQTLDVARAHGFSVGGLSAFRNIKLLEAQAREFSAAAVAVGDETLFCSLKTALADTSVKVLAGSSGICEIAAAPCDRLINAAVGIAGLLPTDAAIRAGNTVALANKETLVAGGDCIMRLAREHSVDIIPVDSEHSAIFQCLNSSNPIEKILLTCSGGAFYGCSKADLEAVTPERIHNPNWDMGRKVTLDSATLANKGLEFIEAVHLFGVRPDQIEILIHRESILHSAVEYADGAVIAQLGMPDMRLPIQYALTYPKRLPCHAKRLSLSDIKGLTFAKPDYEAFPALTGFMTACRRGGGIPAALNAVNDEAGRLFFDGKISFNRIGELIENAAETLPFMPADTLDEIVAADKAGKEYILSHTGGNRG